MKSPSPGFARAASLLGAVFAVFFAATWNGRYIHDGPMFIRSLEEGHWLHVHAAYLPLAHVLRAVLGWLPGFDAERVLGVLAVLSGVAMVAFSADLCARITGNRVASLAAGALVGLAPVVWLASGMVEIHVFAGAGACAGAWLAYALPGRPAWRCALATTLAMAFHMTAVVMVPFFLVLAFQRDKRDRNARQIALAVSVVGAVVFVLRFLGEALPPKVESLSAALPALFDPMLRLASNPGQLAGRVLEEYGKPWMLLALMPLAGLATDRRELRFLAVACFVVCLGGALGLASYISLLGQYGLVLAPALALGAALALARPATAKLRWVLAGLCVAGQLALAVPEHRRHADDPSRAWAEAVAPHVEEPCIVFCQGLGRMRRFEHATGIRPFNFMPVGDAAGANPGAAVIRAVETAHEQGQRVYLDPEVFDSGRLVPAQAPVVRAIERVLETELVPGAPLYLVRGVRKPDDR